MRANGATAILVSGGFTRFAEPVARDIGFDRAIANVLGVADAKLTGAVGQADRRCRDQARDACRRRYWTWG